MEENKKEKEISLLEKWFVNPTKPLLFILVILVIVYLFMRNDCVQDITYIPESQRPTTFGGQGIRKTEGHYKLIAIIKDSVISQSFKTRNEAIHYCISKKIGQED